MRLMLRILGTLTLIVVLPSAAYAQASIAGVVRDASGAVLPGVTVEAASPALIEKVRTVTTDGSGQFRIVDLRPGTYVVTFTLAGFSTVKREGIELAGNFSATVSADMRVGALEETITVSGQAPVVDVTTTRQQQTMDKTVIAAIPSGRMYQNLANLVPAMSHPTRDVGGNMGTQQGAVVAHGSSGTDSRLTIDGMSVGAGGGGGTQYMPPAATAQEVIFNITGGLGDSEGPGTVINMIPREGANTFSGSFFANGANHSMVGSNFSESLRARGLRVPNTVLKVYDVQPTFGGRLIRDRLWFYVTGRVVGAFNSVAGMYVNKNAGNPNAWTYEPDLSRQAFTDNVYKGITLRLTAQLTPRNKVAVYWDQQFRCVNCSGGGTATGTIESAGKSITKPMRVSQATWTSPVTSRLLLDAGFSLMGHRWARDVGGARRTDGTHNPLLIRVQEQAGSIPGLIYRAPLQYDHNWSQTTVWRGAISYITGAHAAKIGYEGGWHPRILEADSNQGLAYRFNNGVPNQLTQYAHPWKNPTDLHTEAFFAQDNWTLGRVMIQGGVRYDFLHNTYPQQQLGPAKLYPTTIVFPSSDSIKWQDVTPRVGAAYDVFGKGKTAVKVSLGKYMASGAGSLGPVGGGVYDFNPIQRMATSTARAWTDANGNFIPDCDLLNGAAQDLRATGGDLCGAFANANYGTANFSSTYDPHLARGWGVRPFQWIVAPSLQQELMPRVSLNVGFVRRWSGNLAVIDNLAVAAADFDRFTLTAPADSRLPGGGNFTVGDLYDVKPAKFGLTNNYLTLARNFGKQIEHYNGYDVGVNAHLLNGLTLQGGFASGKKITDNCEIVKALPEVLLVGAVWQPSSFCHVETPFITDYKGLASYTVPRIDVQVSGAFQILTGPAFSATYNAPTAAVATSLGRPLAGNTANIAVNLLTPNSEYGERYNQVDLRVGKVFRFGGKRTTISLDLYNALNANDIQTYNNTFVPNGTWLVPTLIEVPRVVKVSGQIDF